MQHPVCGLCSRLSFDFKTIIRFYVFSNQFLVTINSLAGQNDRRFGALLSIPQRPASKKPQINRVGLAEC